MTTPSERNAQEHANRATEKARETVDEVHKAVGSMKNAYVEADEAKMNIERPGSRVTTAIHVGDNAPSPIAKAREAGSGVYEIPVTHDDSNPFKSGKTSKLADAEAKENIEKASAKTRENVNYATDKAKEAGSKIYHTTGAYKDAAVEDLKKAGHVASDYATSAKDNVVGSAGYAAQMARDNADIAARKAKETGNSIYHTAGSYKDSAVRNAELAAEKAKETGSSIYHTTGSYKDAAVRNAESAAEKAKETGSSIYHTTGSYKDAAVEKATQAEHAAENFINSAKNTIVEDASYVADKTLETGMSILETVTDIRDAALEKIGFAGEPAPDVDKDSFSSPAAYKDSVTNKPLDKPMEWGDQVYDSTGSKKIGDSTSKGTTLKGSAAEQANKDMHEAADRAKEAGKTIFDTVGELKDAALEKLGFAVEKVKEEGNEVYHKTGSYKDAAMRNATDLGNEMNETASSYKDSAVDKTKEAGERMKARANDSLKETGNLNYDAAGTFNEDTADKKIGLAGDAKHQPGTRVTKIEVIEE